MPVVLFRKDPFLDSPGSAGMSVADDRSTGVRRPLYGYVPKTDRYASLSITQATSDLSGQVPVSILDSSASSLRGYGKSNRNTNFFVTQVSHVDSEKFQIVETFGDDYVFFYGRRPFMLQVSGILLNTEDFNWKSEWLENYETYLRGTKCVERRCRVQFRVDDRLYSGYIMSTQVQDSAETPHAAPFGFQMLVYSQVDLTTRRVVSLQETHIVGENLYVDYIGGALIGDDVWEIGPDGNSTNQGSHGIPRFDSESSVLFAVISRMNEMVDTQNAAFIEGASSVAEVQASNSLKAAGAAGRRGVRGAARRVPAAR